MIFVKFVDGLIDTGAGGRDLPPKYRSSLRDSFVSFRIVEGGSYGPETVHGRSYRADVETGRG